ncbi:MAG: aminotransferase class I/II-fold pyridoxal phosphate-dependent enzyme, partial [Candidatus Dadabacteria bacterium]
MPLSYKEEFKTFLNTIQLRSKTFIGYPTAIDFDYSELYPLLQFSLNNIGDPYVASFDMHTKAFEQEVIQFFAELFNAPQNNHWGYVTAGGSEGNLYALYLARELFPHGMVYYSEATHYSVQKNVHLLNMDSIVIRCQDNGEMDYDDLKETIQLQRHRPAIILANIGTTMTEAKDNVPEIKRILKKFAIKSSYIHCDAA